MAHVKIFLLIVAGCTFQVSSQLLIYGSGFLNALIPLTNPLGLIFPHVCGFGIYYLAVYKSKWAAQNEESRKQKSIITSGVITGVMWYISMFICLNTWGS